MEKKMKKEMRFISLITYIFTITIFLVIACTSARDNSKNNEEMFSSRINKIESFYISEKYFPYFLHQYTDSIKQAVDKPEYIGWKRGVYYIAKTDSVILIFFDGRNDLKSFANIKAIQEYIVSQNLRDSSEFYLVCLSDSIDYQKCYSAMKELQYKKGKEIRIFSRENHQEYAINKSTIMKIKEKQARLIESGANNAQAFIKAAESTILSCPEFAIAVDSIAAANANERFDKLLASVKRISNSTSKYCNKANMIDIFVLFSIPEISYSAEEIVPK